MDINAMMSAVQAQDAKRVASGLAASRGNGVTTSATATTRAGSRLASSSAATGAAATGASASSSTSSSSDITSSDFLTLLVTEMQNQDPTQPTDPNQYIQQLVGVNSLQQLIAINQDLTPTTTTTGGVGIGSTLAVNPMAANDASGNSLTSIDSRPSLAPPATGVSQ